MQSKIIVHINFAKGFRGGESQTKLLVQELATRGYQQKLIVRQNSELANRMKDTENLEIIKLKKPYAFHLASIKDASILHAHETKGAQFCYFANLFYKIPYIITRRVDNPIKQNFFNKKIYENSLSTVVLSKAIKKETLRVSQNINIDIVPDAYSPLIANKKEVDLLKKRFSNKFIIGNIGELDNNTKGQFYLIEAMKKIQYEYENIHLIMLGKGKDKENYQEQAKELTNISFEGFVNNVADYIECFDAFIFPSLHEGMGSSLFDVMQKNVPIAASNVGGIPDIIEDNKNGLLFPAKESEAIFKAIEKLYLSKELREMLSKNAYENIDNFSYEKMADRYLNLYKNFVGYDFPRTNNKDNQ